jgi:hypothetical protein
MPLVFVHGVATRQTPAYTAQAHQRDTLFKELVLPGGAQIFDPDWGSTAVKFNPALPWLPKPGAAEPFSVGIGVGGDSGLGRIAAKQPDVAVDAAFQAGLVQLAAEAAASGDPTRAISEEQTAAFKAAVRYLEQDAKEIDKDVFNPDGSDVEFLSAVAEELTPHAEPTAAAVEPMSLAGDALKWVGRGLQSLLDPVANVSSDAVLRVIRRPASEQVALFLGDIFVYLRWRDTPGCTGTGKRIFEPIIRDLIAASKLRSKTDPLILVCHSLGAVVLYDLLTDRAATSEMAQQIGHDLIIDAWITVGAQPGLFADMGLFTNSSSTPGELLPRPPPVRTWMNVYDYTDVLSFSCEPIFKDVTDFEFDNVTSLVSAHSAYFQRPSFYSRMRSRLKSSG